MWRKKGVSQDSPAAAAGSGGRALRALAAVTLLALPAAAQPAAQRDWWGVVALGGTPVGLVAERESTDPQGLIVTESETAITLNRMGGKVEISGRSTVRERPDGALVDVVAESRLSEQSTWIEARAAAGRLIIRRRSGAESAVAHEEIVPLAEELPGPRAAAARTAAALRQPGDRIALRQFIPDLGGVYTLERTLAATESPVAGDPTRPLLRIEERTEGSPVVRTLWLDADGDLVRQSEPSPFGLLEIRRASRAEAEAARGGGSLSEEMYGRTLVRANVRLPAPRTIDRVLLRLRLRDPALGWPDGLESESQRLFAIDPDGSRRFEVRRPQPAPRVLAAAMPQAAGVAAEFVTANAWIESDDEEIVRLAREIVGTERDPLRRAEALTEWVQRNLDFDLGVVMAPASELVRRRRGTCAGYATLLTALARAAGLPARYAMGYVYVLGIWAGHAWSEIQVGDRWLPFDAALYAPGVADAARFSFARSSLVQGIAPAALAGAQLYGNLDIAVEQIERGGTIETFDAAAAPFRIEGSRYDNPGLGLSLTAPAGFSLARADAVWPDPTLVELRGPGGQVAVVREESRFPEREAAEAVRRRLAEQGVVAPVDEQARSGRRLFLAQQATVAAAAWTDAGSLFTLVVRGRQAAELRDRLVAAIEWRPPASAGAGEAGRPDAAAD